MILKGWGAQKDGILVTAFFVDQAHKVEPRIWCRIDRCTGASWGTKYSLKPSGIGRKTLFLHNTHSRLKLADLEVETQAAPDKVAELRG